MFLLSTESGHGGHKPLEANRLYLGLLASVGTLFPRAKSYPKNPRAWPSWDTPVVLLQRY